MPRRRIGVHWYQGVPHVWFSARDLVSPRIRQELQSGLRKRLVMTIQAFREGGGAPLATREIACGVYWDVWQEVYRVRVGGRLREEPDLEGALERCLVARRLPIGDAEDYAPHRERSIYFAVRAEFNPISRRQCRDLLRPSQGDHPIGPVVINIVRRQICQAERAIQFRSPPGPIP